MFQEILHYRQEENITQFEMMKEKLAFRMG